MLFGNGFFGFVSPVADAYVVYSQYYKKCDLEWKCKLHRDKRKYSMCGNISCVGLGLYVWQEFHTLFAFEVEENIIKISEKTVR